MSRTTALGSATEGGGPTAITQQRVSFYPFGVWYPKDSPLGIRSKFVGVHNEQSPPAPFMIHEKRILEQAEDMPSMILEKGY